MSRQVRQLSVSTRSVSAGPLSVIVALSMAGCSSTRPFAYGGLESAPRLQPSQDHHKPYQYRDAADVARYTKLVMDPVTVYAGKDAQFGSVSSADQALLAEYMSKTFAATLKPNFDIVAGAEPGTARLHLTLTGVETSTPFLSTVTHLVPLGLVTNGVLQVTGSPGTFYGSVSYAVELSDAQTGKLLYAYVTKQAPQALDLTASIRPLDAARSGIRAGARQLRTELQKPTPQPDSTQTASAR